MFELLPPDDEHVLDLCARHLARTDESLRHSHKGYLGTDRRARFSEGWRFPLVESSDQPGANHVTFVWRREMDAPSPRDASLTGTFAPLHERIALGRAQDSIYWYVRIRMPSRECHRYLFNIDGSWERDPVNPQQEDDAAGHSWSRFFTEGATKPLVLQEHERALLARFVRHILPFRTGAADEFLRSPGNPLPKHVDVLDQSVGVVNFIDKVLAREEAHNLVDYQICLREIERVLRLRDPFAEPHLTSKQIFAQLYEEMKGMVPGWNTAVYGSPSHFLRMVRRHAFLGAFAHPKYGGNAGAIGWRFLAERFRDPSGASAFGWEKAIEPPLGASADYHG